MKLFYKNRKRLCTALKNNLNTPQNAVVLLQAGGEQGVCFGDSSDVGPVFRQESFFHWTFGVLEPDYFGALEVATGQSVLFMPRLPEEYAILMGTVKTPKDIKAMYDGDEVYYVEEMNNVLSKICNGIRPVILLLHG